MHHRWRLALLGMILLTAFTRGQEPPKDSGTADIRDVVRRYMDARNNRDAEATRSLFTDDADQLVSSGEWRKGIDELVRGAMASSQKETGKSSITVESIRFLEPNVAIADGRYETSSALTGTSRKMWTTIVLRNTNRGWRITAIRNMLPAGPASGTPR